MKEALVSVFKRADSPEVFKNATVGEILQIIKDCKYQKQIDHLQSLDEEAYRIAKKDLVSITFSGTFSYRQEDKITAYSQILVIDIDKLEEEKLKEVEADLRTNPYVYAMFISPSGHGLKVLVKVSSSLEKHRVAFYLLEQSFNRKYGIEIDTSGKDPCRLCFISADPDLYWNEDAKVLPIPENAEIPNKVDSHEGREGKFVGKIVSDDVRYVFGVCIEWVQRKFQYVEGQRNNFIHNLACSLNRCGVDMKDTLCVIEEHISHMDDVIKKTVRSAYFHNRAEHASIKVYDLRAGSAQIGEYTEDSFSSSNSTWQEATAEMVTDMLSKNISVKVINTMVSTTIKAIYGSTEAITKEEYLQVSNDAYNKFVERANRKSLAVDSVIDMIKSVASNMKGAKGITTSFTNIDAVFGGSLKRGNAYGLIGMPGAYKSIVAEVIAIANSINGYPSLYLNGEMSKVQYAKRMIENVLGLDLRFLETAPDFEHQLEVLGMEASNKIGNNLFTFTGTDFDRESIINTVTDYRNQGKDISVVVIDGLSQMSQPKSGEIANLIFNAEECKKIAKEGDVCVIMLSHVSGGCTPVTRNAEVFIRGAGKVMAALDGFLCTSLFIDEQKTSNLSNDQIVYRTDKFFMKAKDKRDSGEEINTVINVSRPLKLEFCHENPSHFEVKLN